MLLFMLMAARCLPEGCRKRVAGVQGLGAGEQFLDGEDVWFGRVKMARVYLAGSTLAPGDV